MVRICEPAGEADGPQDMHGEERSIQKDKRQEEMHFPPKLIHRPSEHFREPEVNSSPNAHCRSSKEDIVEMSNDEICVMNKNVNRRRCHKNPR